MVAARLLLRLPSSSSLLPLPPCIEDMDAVDGDGDDDGDDDAPLLVVPSSSYTLC